MFDIIIVGGGLVGASLACALNHLPLRIALIDALPEHQDDPRLIALHYGSCQLLTNLNLWDQLTAAASPIKQVHVSTKNKFGSVRLTQEEANLPYLGHVIPARVLNQVLNDKMRSLPQLSVFRPARLKKLWQDDGIATITIDTPEGEQTLQSPIVIAADGTHSTVRTQLNIDVEEFDYNQSAIVTITELKRSHQNIAYERFTPAGTIAMLPLTEQRVATIWSADNTKINALMQLSDEAFLAELQKEFGYRLGRLQSIQKRHHFPLKQVRAKTTAQQSVLLLGNAAHTLHPVAAQGLNLALYEVACLVESLSNIPHSTHLTSHELAQALEQAQKQQNASINLSHRLARLINSEFFLAPFMRQIGMIGLDLLPGAKQHFIKQMTGKAGKVPRLLLPSIPSAPQ